MRRVLIAFSLAVLVCVTPACSSPPPEEAEFAERVRALEAVPASALPEHEEQEDEGGFVNERRSVELPRPTLEAGGAEALAADVLEAGLEIYVFNMAQADSTLVVGPPPERRALLIDLGEQNNGDRKNYLRVAERILDITEDTHIDYFLISHFHGDHIE